jgi:hypothetical protein
MNGCPRPVRSGLRAGAAGVLLCALVIALDGCGVPAPDTDWDAAVARTVARRVQAAYPEVDVRALGRVGSADGTELPWAVRQALTTAGIEIAVSNPTRDGDTMLLVFERSARDGAEWQVDVRLENEPPATTTSPAGTPPPDVTALTWRVRCVGGACEAVDSVIRAR